MVNLEDQNTFLNSYLVKLQRFATNLLVLGHYLIFKTLNGFFEYFLALIDFLNFLSFRLKQLVLFV